MPYVENIKVGSGESWPIRDKEGRELIAEIWSTIYPVGSIYMSVNSTNPESLFGGTWERIQDTFLLAAGDSYGAGTTGGEATHTLTVDEMPSHGHIVKHSSDNNAIELHWTNNLNTTTGSTKALYIDYFSDGDTGSIIDTAKNGGSQPHPNMPPYLAVYMWKRTA